MDRISLSIVIPCYNALRTLPQIVDHLISYSTKNQNLDLILVDDGSTDGTREYIENLSCPFPLEKCAQDNLGAGKARNKGGLHSTADVLLFLDADILPGPHLISEHLRFHEQFPNAFAVGKVIAYDIYYKDTANYVEYELGDTRNHYIHNGEEQREVEVPYYNGWSGNLSIKRNHFLRLGGFDEKYDAGSGYEDIDLSYRACASGLRLLYLTNAMGYHDHPRKMSDHFQRSYKYAYWCNYFVLKHPAQHSEIPISSLSEPINLRKDDLYSISKKIQLRILGLNSLHRLMESFLYRLQDHWPATRVAKFLYWRVNASYTYQGFLAGKTLNNNFTDLTNQ